jgi:glycosyltransferase involved in cell wall biosynthesis
MSLPLVSIIIPTYNRSHLIGETLDSIIAQTYIKWECIIVDDGSKDNPDILLKKYSDNDKRFRFYKRPPDKLKGGNAARNYGFVKSRGDFIQWFDSDDLMLEDFLTKKMELFAKNNELDFVFCGFETFGANKTLKKNYKGLSKSCLENIFLKERITLNTQSFLFKRSAVEQVCFDENLKRSQDLDFLFRVLTKKQCLKWSYVSSILVKIRMHNQSITTSKFVSVGAFNSEMLVLNRMRLFYYKKMDSINLNLIKIRYNDFLLKLLEGGNYSFYFRGLFLAKVNFFIKLILVIIFPLYFFTKRGGLFTKKIMNL